MKDRTKKGGNGGFTLVEVLIGVAILAIIVAPLLQGFLTSAVTAKRAQNTRNETVAEQDIVETFKSANLDDLVRSATGTGTSFSSLASSAELCTKVTDPATGQTVYTALASADDTAGSYCFRLRGVSVSNTSYDAEVDLDASQFPSNGNSLVKYQPLDAVYTQPSGNADPDTQAAEKFAADATVLSGAEVDASYFENKMTRNVTVVIENDPVSGLVTGSIHFSYSCNYAYTVNEGTADDPKYVPYTEPMSADFYENDFFRKSSVKSIYIFYYPSYSASGDNIDIENQDDIACNIFLVKQVTPAISDDLTLYACETAYRATVALHEAASAGMGGTAATVGSNMNKYVSNQNFGALLQPANFTYYTYKGDWFQTGTLTELLTDLEQQNRLYKVNIKLYPAGGGFDASRQITSFNASYMK